MDEEKSYEWLKDQTITVPVEEFINMRLGWEEVKRQRDDMFHEKWEWRSKYDELKNAYETLKADYQKLLGIKEEEGKQE